MSFLRVALDLPLHRSFDYRWPEASADDIGLRVRVPFGRGERIGVIVGVAETSDWPAEQVRPAAAILRDLPPLGADFLALCDFAARYYQAAPGEAILQALPAGLKRLAPPQRREGRGVRPVAAVAPPELTDEQRAALAAVSAAPRFVPWLLHGVTGSGKTEVYLQLMAATLAAGRQALVLVPEINLTPQLESRVRARFPQQRVVALHSELAEAARERHWREAQAGEAAIVLGTRLAVFASLPRLGLIIVDEEHDPSFKQQDGMRYSARDVAVFRARLSDIPIVLGSATPSLESWANAQAGRYRLLTLAGRAVAAARLPVVNLVDSRRETVREGIGAALEAALAARLERGEQSLVFLNRRGYAPVLACAACGWTSRCRRCAANLVLHQADRRLRCHHCGFETRVPRACPTCGNQDIQPFGRGTQRLEAWLTERFPAARVLRVDRDAVKSRRQWESILERIHAGEADILVGTQMLAKGHDFPRLTLVGVVGADAALFAADWRAPERLFAQLMQVAGRAGRAELPGEVLVQTRYPEHPLYAALAAHDYPGFAAAQLQERRQAGFPPYAYQAILRAEAPAMSDAIAFLATARAHAEVGASAGITAYDPVPLRLSRVAERDRAQLLLESGSRRALQDFLPLWREKLETIRVPAKLRWHLEVDPLEC
ncbi:MAG: primosomal protein N' [Azonexus sp.]|nr:primosomal protein N' [Betaproteobacteria bacterium]MBK8919679.1 primosomal protein N' [Betaproteobacteria bacterium]MBP6034921.1 primosomal protein N' [Azonexus sp.]MBP6905627.1 primosomal protein N' [Azonexus sp.]